MTVFFDARYSGETGVGRYVIQLARQLEGHGRLRYRFLREYSAARSTDIPVRGRPFAAADQFRLALILRRLHPQLFHCPHFLVPILWRGPLVVTIHDVIPLDYPQSIASPFARRLYPLLVRLACARALRVLVPSNATGDALVQHGLTLRDRIVVTPPGPPLLVGPARSDNPAGGFILFVGDLKPHKNLGTLLRAYSGLAPQFRRRVRLVVVGDGPEKKRLQERARSLGVAGNVVFAGHVEDSRLSALYAGALFVVLPSFAEGFGLTALEAMAHGVPVIVSDIPALRETTAGAALSFDSHDSDALRAALARLLDDDVLRTELAARGRRRAEAFSWSTTARLTEDAYEMALSD
ncbi:MAG: glycosyltransferase family 4 protein [Chloroflexota bacterium]|nr:glycosyltransferase family 4 protein [Chloroflexota bacterium]